MRNLEFKMCLVILTLIGSLLLSACNSEDQTLNNISELNVTFNQQDQTYHLQWQATDPSLPVSLSVAGADADFTPLITQLQASTYSWRAEDNTIRYTFRVEPENGKPAQSATRWLTLEGGKNFRDLGGYHTADGHQVRWGKLLRSGALASLTDNDFTELKPLNIGSVIDFRSPPERQADPTNWQLDGTEIVNADYHLDMANFGKVFMEPDLTAEKVEAAMASSYPDILVGLTGPFTDMFDRLASSDQAMVFHCTAGKDRTGIAAALILTALGVDRETIMADFMLSDLYYSQMVSAKQVLGKVGNTIVEQAEAGRSATEDSGTPAMGNLPPELMRPLAGVRESYLKTTFAAMEAKSGTVLAYIQQELNVTDEELKQLRANFLEPAL